jgi:hypothetical protein
MARESLLGFASEARLRDDVGAQISRRADAEDGAALALA